jgi:hypothetical protein
LSSSSTSAAAEGEEEAIEWVRGMSESSERMYVSERVSERSEKKQVSEWEEWEEASEWARRRQVSERRQVRVIEWEEWEEWVSEWEEWEEWVSEWEKWEEGVRGSKWECVREWEEESCEKRESSHDAVSTFYLCGYVFRLLLQRYFIFGLLCLGLAIEILGEYPVPLEI